MMATARRNFALATLCLTFVVGFATLTLAQDSHYWTLQYGPKSSLLGGAVIGSVDDVSATFYNPGALARARNLSFAVSTNVFEISGALLEDGGGRGVDLGRQSSGLRPSMVAGTIADSLFGGRALVGYSAMNRVKGTQEFQGLLGLRDDEIDPSLGLSDLFGLIRFEGEFSDFWAGMTYAHRIGEHFGIGATGYVASRSQRRRRETLGEAIYDDGRTLFDIEIAGGSFSSIRVLSKLGAFAKFGDLTAGVTFTTPSAQIMASGELGLNYAAFKPDTTGLAYTIQRDLPVTYKTPASIGGGVGLPIGPARLHASAEWYDSVEPYTVIQGNTINAVVPEETAIEVDAVQELASVFNWGVGVEFSVSKRFNGYLSYYQDNSSLTDDIERSSLAIMPFDIQAVTAGTDFVVGPVLLTLGVGYGWGERLDTQLTDVLDPGGEQGLQARFVFRSIRALFGFEVGV